MRLWLPSNNGWNNSMPVNQIQLNIIYQSVTKLSKASAPLHYRPDLQAVNNRNKGVKPLKLSILTLV